jgi:RNA polymerase-interacting CarD/CdnL/TRCF family regulator
VISAALKRGNLIEVASVVRDLHHDSPAHGPGTSRQRLYAAALDWLVRETAIVEGTTFAPARNKIITTLNEAT